MGYYTNYSVSFINNEVEQPELQEIENCNLSEEMKAQLIRMIEDKYSSQKMDRDKLVKELNFDPFDESCKWYDYNADMKNISSKYPNTIFILSGDGEEPGDIWRKYYYQGKVQDANVKFVYDDFDESKLA